MNVFIVEDSPVIVDRLMAMLEELGEGLHVIGNADDADDAIAAIQTLKPDAVILDIQLTTGTGFDVLDAVKRDRHRPLIVMFSSYPEEPYRRRCLDAGADYYFDKSTQFARVGEVFQQLVEAWQAA